MNNLFELLTLALSIATALLSYHAYSLKTGVSKNISVFIMISAVVTTVALLFGLSGVLAEGSIIEDVLDKSGTVTSVMLLLTILEVQKIKK